MLTPNSSASSRWAGSGLPAGHWPLVMRSRSVGVDPQVLGLAVDRRSGRAGLTAARAHPAGPRSHGALRSRRDGAADVGAGRAVEDPAHQGRGDDHAVGVPGGGGGTVRGVDAEADEHGPRAVRRARAATAHRSASSRSAGGSGRGHDAHDIEETAGAARRWPASAWLGRGGRDHQRGVQASVAGRVEVVAGLGGGQVGDDRAADPGVGELAAVAAEAAAVGVVGVGHRDQRDAAGVRPGRAGPGSRASVAPRPMAAAEACWMTGPSSIGSENGSPISTASAPRRSWRSSRPVQSAPDPAGDVGDEAGPARGAGPAEGGLNGGHGAAPSGWRRPCRRGRTG